MGVAEQQCHLHGLVLHALEGLADIDAQLAQLTDVLFIDVVHLSTVRYVEDYPHYRLTRSHRAVNLGVYFVHAHRITFSHEGVEHILTELLAFDDDLLVLRVHFWIECSERVDSIGALGNP